MKQGNYWTVEFTTGEEGNRYSTRKAAQQYADACNAYSERHQGERVVRGVVQYREFSRVKTVAA